jgi:asparagine synthetase B (glutamine-hydrolysing)
MRPLLPNDEIRRRLVNRGPDSINTTETICPRTTAREQDAPPRDIHVTIFSTVLSLRGSVTVIQPYQDPDGKYTLCWNGEAWSIGGEPTRGNDTRAIHRLLVDALESSSSVEHSSQETLRGARIVAEALSQVAGPYAFVLFDHARRRLFFGRDFLGRRSLLKQVTYDGDLLISSITDGNPANGWTEIEAVGVYCIDLRNSGSFAALREPEVPPGSHMRQLDQYIAAFAPYNFIEPRSCDKGTPKSVGTKR